MGGGSHRGLPRERFLNRCSLGRILSCPGRDGRYIHYVNFSFWKCGRYHHCTPVRSGFNGTMRFTNDRDLLPRTTTRSKGAPPVLGGRRRFNLWTLLPLFRYYIRAICGVFRTPWVSPVCHFINQGLLPFTACRLRGRGYFPGGV